MAQTSKVRIKDMSIDPSSIKLPEKYRIDKNTLENQSTSEKKDNGGFETMVDRFNKKKPKKPPELRQSHHRGHGRISNWVCVKNTITSEVLRVRREDAEKKLIPTGKYQYTNKTEWRNFINKNTENAESTKRNNKTLKKANRKKKNSNKKNIKESC